MQAHVNTDFIAILAPSVQKRMSNLDPKSSINSTTAGEKKPDIFNLANS